MVVTDSESSSSRDWNSSVRPPRHRNSRREFGKEAAAAAAADCEPRECCPLWAHWRVSENDASADHWILSENLEMTRNIISLILLTVLKL